MTRLRKSFQHLKRAQGGRALIGVDSFAASIHRTIFVRNFAHHSKCCVISSPVVLFVHLPFSGTTMSGNAREGLHETLLDMTEQKTLLVSGVFSA